MDSEPEVIRQQMEETRASLTEKLETLEQQVVGTVQGATTAVSETVESVKEAVQQTVDTVKGSVQDTVDSVKDTFDVPRQVDRYPWLMMGGAIALGYVGGRLLLRSSEGPRTYWSSPPTTNGRRDSPPTPEYRPAAAAPPSEADSGWLGAIGDSYGPEIARLKGLAIGAVLGLVRDAIARSAPEPMRPRLTDVIDSITTKVGGQPIAGPVLSYFSPDRPENKGECHEGSYAAEMGRPLGTAQG